MNTSYQRDAGRTLPDPARPVETTAPGASERPSPLAVHGDPSHRRVTTPLQTLRSKHGVAWVRPSDLPTMLGSKVIGRGLDLKQELVRRAHRRTRPTAPKGSVTKTAIASPAPPDITHSRPGGISL